METPLRHVQNNPTTITTPSQQLTIDMQQTNCNTHNKARIPVTISQQVYDYCITTSLQQVHNRMILYGNQGRILTGL